MTPQELDALVADSTWREREFPVCQRKIFLGHAGVTVLPRRVADAVIEYTERCARDHQEFGSVIRDMQETRRSCARLIGAGQDEIALLGPTSLGLSLFANGIDWRCGDEIVCYHGDYPANVYPWMALEKRGVILRYLEPERPGLITPELVKAALTPKTRLVALASCNFFTGDRIDVDAIGRMLRAEGVLFSLDAIQTLGAFPTSVEYVDFLSADAHKWLLGPLAIGVVYVRRALFPSHEPTLLGAWNVKSPNFITQSEIEFVDSAQRYEPGVLNMAGIYGMKAAVDWFLEIGPETVADRIVRLRDHAHAAFAELGFVMNGPAPGDAGVSGICTFRHASADMAGLFERLEKAGIVASLRHDREGRAWLRVAPHFYNTEAELDMVADLLRKAL